MKLVEINFYSNYLSLYLISITFINKENIVNFFLTIKKKFCYFCKMKLNLENLAPISVSVYTRLKHFKNCINSLAANSLAKHSELYVFSDNAKSGDEEAVLKVRNYSKSIKGFKKVNLIFQKKMILKKI